LLLAALADAAGKDATLRQGTPSLLTTGWKMSHDRQIDCTRVPALAMNEPPVPESSLRFAASPTLNYAFIATLVGACGIGVWFFATQTETNRNEADRQMQYEIRANSRMDGIEKREDMRTTNMNEIRDRLIGLEATSKYIAANLGKR